MLEEFQAAVGASEKLIETIRAIVQDISSYRSTRKRQKDIDCIIDILNGLTELQRSQEGFGIRLLGYCHNIQDGGEKFNIGPDLFEDIQRDVERIETNLNVVLELLETLNASHSRLILDGNEAWHDLSMAMKQRASLLEELKAIGRSESDMPRIEEIGDAYDSLIHDLLGIREELLQASRAYAEKTH